MPSGRRRHQRRDHAGQSQPRRGRQLLGAGTAAFEGAEISSGSAPRLVPSSAYASIRRRWSRNTASSASTNGPTRKASRMPPGRPGVTGICGSAIIEVVAEMYSPASSRGRRGRRQPGRGKPAHHPERAATSPYLLRGSTGRAAHHRHPERHPRHPARWPAAAPMPASSFDGQAGRGAVVDTIRFAGAFGSFIDPKYAMVLGLDPSDCDTFLRRSRPRQCRGHGAR